MKIVHTGDWHVGKAIRGRHRGQEYRDILDELKQFLESENVDLLLVAGDIFDTGTPSAESEDIVYNFFHDVSRLGVRSVVIAGNHDSGLRFEAIANLMALAKTTVLGFVAPESSEKSQVLVTSRDGKDTANVIMIPFIPERFFVRAEELFKSENVDSMMRYSSGVGKLLEKFTETLTPDKINIAMAHLLMHGAKPGGGERRLFLGDNYAVHPHEVPANLDYFALAHIHRYQEIEGPAPMYYCGSPLQLDFGEARHEKGFLFLETRAGETCMPKFIPFKSGKRLKEIKGTWEEIESILTSEPELQEAFLKITVTTDASSLGVLHKLKKQLPNAVDVRREFINLEQKEFMLPQSDSKWLPDLYREFHQKHHERPVSKEVIEEFEKLYVDCRGG